MSSTPPLSPLDVCFCLQVSLSHPAQNIRDITKVKMCRYFWGRGVNTTKYNLNLSSSRKRITDTTWWDEEKTSVTGAVRTGGTGLGRRTRKVSPPLTLYPEVLWRNCNMNVFFKRVDRLFSWLWTRVKGVSRSWGVRCKHAGLYFLCDDRLKLPREPNHLESSVLLGCNLLIAVLRIKKKNPAKLRSVVLAH